MRPQIVKITVLGLCLLFPLVSFAQDPPPPTGPPPPGVPIDASILFLFAAGLIFGIYFAIKKSRLSRQGQ